MKTTYKLSSYINKIEALYGKAREDYNKAVEGLTKLEDSHSKKLKSGELNSIGIQKENERYYAKKKEFMQAFETVRNTFSAGVSEVRKNADALFRNNYCVNTEDVDLKGVQILNSGMLTDTELLDMAFKYREQGNLTMYRLVGTYADEKSDMLEMRQLAVDAKRMRGRADLQTIDGFAESCLAGLRDDVMLANGIDDRHSEFYDNSYRNAENITIEIETPWNAD